MRKINKLIVHCAATREGQHITVEQIRDWHVKGRGWSDIGYHYVVYLDGSVHEGRPIEKTGAHTIGQNQNSIGICYVGGMNKEYTKAKDTRTPEQKVALEQLLLDLKSTYCDAVVHGHRDFANKACPSFDATTEYKWISDYYNGTGEETKETV